MKENRPLQSLASSLGSWRSTASKERLVYPLVVEKARLAVAMGVVDDRRWHGCQVLYSLRTQAREWTAGYRVLQAKATLEHISKSTLFKSSQLIIREGKGGGALSRADIRTTIKTPQLR